MFVVRYYLCQRNPQSSENSEVREKGLEPLLGSDPFLFFQNIFGNKHEIIFMKVTFCLTTKTK